ncbi:hypothetical protein GLYMA_19G178550v4 [Glycine max]|nr:hypothetical protein GLYMA_19G178550v4 [Glycine max]KAH1078388.1 hypothetical protein GYH30_053409 [Glycine max]
MKKARASFYICSLLDSLLCGAPVYQCGPFT